MSYSIEYLITIESKGGFCNSIDTFNNLLKSYAEIKIKDGKIIFKKIEITYVVNTNEITNQNQRYFHVFLTIQALKDEAVFLELLKMFREIIFKASGKINILWDDISAYYSGKCYPLIHETENLLRMLISKFMLINLGMEWSTQTVPSEIQKSIKNKRSQSGVTDILHDVDFIQLSDFLFKPYQTKGLSSLYGLLAQIKTESHFDNKALLEYIPKSNWERYFSGFVDCDDGYLLKRWEKLYELRCLIAHNTVISKKDYQDVQLLCSEVKKKLSVAIKDLDKVVIPEGDIDVVHENVASNLNELNGQFLEKWKTLRFELLSLLKVTKKLTPEELKLPSTESSIVKMIGKYELLDSKIIHKINELRNFRHQVVHEQNHKISEKQLESKIQELSSLCVQVKSNVAIQT